MSPFAAKRDNEATRAGIIDGSINPIGLNIRELIREVTEQRDAARVAGGVTR